jgi:hypothetical protein
MVVSRPQFRIAGVPHGRRNYVLAAGPFSEVNQTTARAAERKFGITALYRLFAGRALQTDGALASHKSS